MNYLSSKGVGIDTIGKELNLDGATVRYNLIKILGKEGYEKRHPRTRYTENNGWNGWNGKNIEYNGNWYQSNLEVEVAKILEELKLNFNSHVYLPLGDKKYYPDFYLPSYNLYIECAGMLDRGFYRVKFINKINDYSMYNINFLVVSSDTFNNFLDSLKERLSC